MIFKYYTADLKVIGEGDLEAPSIFVKVLFFKSPLHATRVMKNALDSWDCPNHGLYNFRRIK